MKNIILILTLSFCFTQTAMLSKKGDDALGVWCSKSIYNIEYSEEINLETDNLRLHVDYKTDFGLEIGMDYYNINETFDIGFSLHKKSENNGINVWGRIKVFDIFEEYDFLYNLGDKRSLSIGAYTNDLVNLTIEHTQLNLSDSEYDYNWTNIEIGMMIPTFNNLGIGISYRADTDYINEGNIILTLGLNVL